MGGGIGREAVLGGAVLGGTTVTIMKYLFQDHLDLGLCAWDEIIRLTHIVIRDLLNLSRVLK